jgi:hypothetical protein
VTSLHKKFPNYSSGKCSHRTDKRSGWIAMNLKFWRFHFVRRGRQQNPIEFSYHKTQFPCQFLIRYLFDINHVRFSRGDVSLSVLCTAVTIACYVSFPFLDFFTFESSRPFSSYLLKPVARPTQSPVTSGGEASATLFLKEFHNITRNTPSKSEINSFVSRRKFQRICSLQLF